MRKTFFATFFIFLFCLNGQGQNCLPNGIFFSTQAEIDNFSVNYPGCTVIEGGVTISGADITNLNGLSGLTSVMSITIKDNISLANLNGLENLTSVEYLAVNGNSGLTNLSGLGNLTSIDGDLIIYGNSGLVNLSGMEHLTSVKGTLSISGNPGLTNLSGLENISSVGGVLYIGASWDLTSLSGLENITSIGSNLQIDYNPGLTNLSGLEGLKSIGEGLLIISNLGLTSLSGLENLTSVGGWLYISANTSLPSLSGLDNLTSVGGSLQIEYNSVLTSLNGLNNLTSVGGIPQIQYNPGLTSLGGLQNLSSIGGNALYITDNQSLSDCAIFAVCNYLLDDMGLITIYSNAPGCGYEVEIESQCVGIPVTVAVQLDNNGNCLPDTNDTPAQSVQVRLSGDTQMSLRSSGPDGVARLKYLETGAFSLHLPQFPTSNWAVCQDSVVITPDPGSQDTIKATMLLSPLTQCPELTASLGLPSNFRGCLVNTGVQVAVQNTGTVLAEGVKMAVVVPPVFELVSSTPLFSAQDGDTLFFEMGDLKPFETAIVNMTVKTKCDTFLLERTLCVEVFARLTNPCPSNPTGLSEIKLSAQCIGDSLVRFYIKNIGEAPTQGPHKYVIIKNDTVIATGDFSLGVQETLPVDVSADGATFRMEATKYDDGTLTATAIENCRELTPGLITAFWLDEGPVDYDFDCRQVIGSYDPNQKTAVPTGTGPQGLIVANRSLQYTIDFQNTGTDTAFRVLLRDVLPQHLDISTFRPGFSSHPCTWEIRDNLLEVLFFPIMLPDSNVNEAASHGFFNFKIDQKPNLPDGTYFQNTASIIFDFNPPIVTNTVWHTIGKLTVRVDEPQQYPNLWEVHGNPVRDAATFRTEEFIAGEKRFELYDAAGRPLRSAQFSGQEFEFQRDLLPSGLYFFKISDELGRMFTGKIVVAD